MVAPILNLSLDDLRARTSAKWVRYPADVIPAWVAEMDVPLLGSVREALDHAFEIGDTGYPTPPPYVEAFAGFAERHWDWQVEPARAALVPDVMMGILVLLLQVTGEGDTVVINDPVYPPFDAFPKLAGRKVSRAALTDTGRLDLAALESAFGEATTGNRRAAFLLCNPHNPTGVVHTREELRQVAELADRYGVVVISDEIHAPLVYAGSSFTSYLQIDGVERGYAVHSAAKTFSLAGLKAGIVIAAGRDTEVLSQLAVGPNASLSGVIAHAAAWNNGDEWLGQLLQELDLNRMLVAKRVADDLPGVSVPVPEGTYLMWLDCRETGLGDDPAAVFLDQAKVALNPGLSFGPRGAGHVRLNIATSLAILDEVLDRLAGALTTVR